MAVLPKHNSSVESYICDGLQYCCTWGFFQLYPGPKWTATVAARLGVDPRRVRECRASAKECPHAAGCKIKAITKILAAEPDGLQTRKE